MKFGQLRQPVTVQRRYVGQAPGGETVMEWVDEASIFAKVAPLRGDEFFSAEAEQSETTHRVTMRARPTGRPRAHDTRIRLRDGRLLEVEAVIDREERGEVWELMCREGNP